MKASDAVAKLLSLNNVTVGFELMGGMIAHLVDSINLLGETNLVSLHHEQSAAFAAGGVARASNNNIIGLALGTSGPGATNLVTGIADCWLDSYPCVFITGQVNTNELKGDRNVRQQGFQELDIVSIVKSITKYAVQISSADEIIPELEKAIDIARSGRPGPVLIDIPMDLQRAEVEIDFNGYTSICDRKSSSRAFLDLALKKELHDAVHHIYNSKRPLFLVGGGAVNSPSFRKWLQYISEQNIPYVASLKGSEKTPALRGYMGMVGVYGTRTANFAIQNADVIVVLGSRLDVRQTGANINDFARAATKIIQVDLDSDQLNNRVKGDINIVSSCEDYFIEHLKLDRKNLSNPDWNKTLNEHWDKHFVNEYSELAISPFNLCSILSKRFYNQPVHFVTDVGNNQMWVAHSLLLSGKQMIHHSGGLGAMGFGIPTSIGVHYATDSVVVSISGDGGAQLNIQELDIISRENLPILTIIVNNESLGMVRAFQEMYFDGRNSSTYWQGYSSSFSDIGKSYQMKSIKVEDENQFDLAIIDFIQNPEPTMIEVIMKGANECKPRVSFGSSIDKQYPLGDS